MRIVLFEDGRCPGYPVSFMLRQAGVPYARHHEPGAIVRAVLTETPDAIVWSLRPESVADLATLKLIKAIAPEVPLLLVKPDSLGLTTECRRELCPAFVGGLPRNAVELFEVIDGLRATTTSV